MTWRRSGALVVSLTIVVTACVSTPSPAPSAGQSAAPPSVSGESTGPSPIDYEQLLHAFKYRPSSGTPGGSVTIGRPFRSRQLNPYFSNDFAENQVLAATMPTLLTVSADGHWMPWLSDGPITYSGNVKEDGGPSAGFTVHVGIKPNLKWSDGEPFSLNDMEYTWTAVLDAYRAGLNIAMNGWDQVDRIDVSADGMQADIHFKEPNSSWLGVVGSSTILPEHYMTDIPFPDWPRSYSVSAGLAHAVTLGPFKYAAVTADSIELVRDDNWAGPAEACGGKACLDRVIYRLFPDNKEGEITAFLEGEIDLALGLVQGVDDGAITDVDPAIGGVVFGPNWAYEHLDFNQAGLGQGRGHPALRDLVVREAIAQAIDKKALWEAVFPGAVYPNNNPCTDATPGNYWRLPDAKCPPFDVIAANAALDAAGYAKGADGIRVDPKSGTPLEFEHCTMTVSFRELGSDFIAKSLEAVGIKLNVNPVDAQTILFANWADVTADTKCNLARGTYDTSEFLYVIGLDLQGNYDSYHSEQIPSDASKGYGFNYVRFANDEMDAAIDSLKSAITPEDQLRAAYKVQGLYIAQVPEVALYYPVSSIAVSAKLHNFAKNPSAGSDMWNIQDWWLTP